MRTYVYIDGLNLYHRALQSNPELKWLDIEALCKQRLPKNDIVRINYYTARVSGKHDKDAPARQKVYLDALETLPLVQIHLGKVVSKPAKMLLHYGNKPSPLMPKPWLPLYPRPKSASVWKNQEKGSDVSLGAHLVRDAAMGKFDVAAVITNDTDLCEPIRIVIKEFNYPVGLLTPVPKPAKSFRGLPSFIRHIDRNRLLKAQFPDKIPNSDIVKNKEWVSGASS